MGNGEKATVEQVISEELTTFVNESFDDILCTSYNNTRSGIRSVFYIVMEQAVLDPLCKDVIGEKILYPHRAKFFETNAAANRSRRKGSH